MKNLNRLMDREAKWYKIFFIPFPRGIPKKLFYYFAALEGLALLLDEVPLSPFWLFNQMGLWGVTYFIVPILGAKLLHSMRKAGKSPERYLLTIIQFALSNKRVNPYREVDKVTLYSFGTGYTVRTEPRKEETDD
jgi:hypothetical protein